jgi:hypothetical protein
MEPIVIILSALTAKFAADVSSEVARKAYDKLRALVQNRIDQHRNTKEVPRDSISIVDQIQSDPEQAKRLLADASVERDPEIMELAREILRRLDGMQGDSGKLADSHMEGAEPESGGQVNTVTANKIDKVVNIKTDGDVTIS